MVEKQQPIRGLRSVRLGEYDATLTYAQILELEKLGTIKDEGITQNTGSETEEKWTNSMGGTEDSFAEREQSTYEGVLLLDGFNRFAALTGGTTVEVVEGERRYIKYTGPDGSNVLKKAIYIETDTTPVADQPIVWAWKKANLTIYPNLNFGRKNWLEATFRITPLGPDESFKPVAVAEEPVPEP